MRSCDHAMRVAWGRYRNAHSDAARSLTGEGVGVASPGLNLSLRGAAARIKYSRVAGKEREEEKRRELRAARQGQKRAPVVATTTLMAMAVAMDTVLLGGTCRCTATPTPTATSPTPIAAATGTTTVTGASSQPPRSSTTTTTTTTMRCKLTSHSLASSSSLSHSPHFSVQAPRASTSSCSPSSSSRSCRQGISISDRNSACAITRGNFQYCGAHLGCRGGGGRRGPAGEPRDSFARRGGLLRRSDEMDCAMPHLMDTAPFRGVCQAPPSRVRDARDSSVPMAFFGFGKSKLPDVVQAGDPVLHEPAEEVKREDIGSARIEKTINDMVDVMRAGPGVGLAAPQIGVPLQIMVLEDTKELMSYTSPEECEAQQRAPFDLMVIINPKLEKKESGGTAFFFEGCLSVGGHRALVERHLEVEVRGVGRDGQPVGFTARGWKARIVQHEFDHLQGLLYVDKMVKRTFRTTDNLRLPLPAGCPRRGASSSPP